MLVKIDLLELETLSKEAQAMSDYYFEKWTKSDEQSDLKNYKEYNGQEIMIGRVLEMVRK